MVYEPGHSDLYRTGKLRQGDVGTLPPGNDERSDWGKLFCLIHNRAFLPMDLDEIDYVIFGHTHFPKDEMIEGIRFINPGTAGNDRGAGTSMAILHLEGDSAELERIRL